MKRKQNSFETVLKLFRIRLVSASIRCADSFKRSTNCRRDWSPCSLRLRDTRPCKEQRRATEQWVALNVPSGPLPSYIAGGMTHQPQPRQFTAPPTPTCRLKGTQPSPLRSSASTNANCCCRVKGSRAAGRKNSN